MILLFSAFSSSLRKLSRWSGMPSITLVSQVPQTPSVQEKATLTPASSNMSRMLSPGGTAMTRPLRCRCTSKPAGSAEVELSVTASVLLLPNALQGVAEIGAESGFHMRAAEIDP
jgi:hypothetical protein